MANRKIIIEIPEDKYDRLIQQMRLDRNFSACKISLLPKGHGRIGDLDVARGKIEGYQDLIRSIGELTPDKASDLILLGRGVELIDEVDPIIEADEGETFVR